MKTKHQLILCSLLLAISQYNLQAQSWNISGNAGTNANNNFLGTTDNIALVFRTNNVERLRIKTGGFVGIGTTNPNSLLHVKGIDSLVASFDGGVKTYAGFYENDVYRGYIGSFSGNAEDVDFGTGIGNTTGKLHLTIQAIPKLTINSTGDVGIGTTSPAVKLHVFSGTSATPGGGGYIVAGPTNSTNVVIDNNEIMARNNGAVSALLLNKDGGNVNIGSGGLFFQDSTHRVGIGTTSPAVKLHVTGGTNVTLSGGGTIVAGLLNAANLAMDNTEIQARNNGAAGTLFFNKNGGDVNIGSGELFFKSSNSRVGIGTTAPDVKLQVVGGTDVSLGGGGTIVAGSLTANNLAIDNTEIQARNNGAADTLSLNAGGGIVQTGGDLKINGGDIFLGNTSSLAGGNFRIISDGSFVPSFDNGWALGSPSVRWTDVWAADGTINTSDARDKTNIRDLNYGLKEIMKLHSVRFNWKNKVDDADKLGLIAQDLQKVLPEVVRDYENKTDEKTGKKEKMPSPRLGVMYADIIPVLIKGMQEQQEQIQEQQKQINDQNKKIEELTTLVHQIAQGNPLQDNASALHSSDMLTGASLKQNAPNPFNQQTIINYYLPQSTGNAFINITDMNGRMIKSAAVTAKGNGQLILQAATLGSGTYQYSLIVNGKLIDSKKMVILK